MSRMLQYAPYPPRFHHKTSAQGLTPSAASLDVIVIGVIGPPKQKHNLIAIAILLSRINWLAIDGSLVIILSCFSKYSYSCVIVILVQTYVDIISMSRLASPDWLMLPELVWEEIILMVGLSSLRDLDSCIQVCRAWNTVIRSKINPTNKWGGIIQQRLEKRFDA